MTTTHCRPIPIRKAGMCAALLLGLITSLTLPLSSEADQQFGTPKGDEGTRLFKATEHDNYTGQFHVVGQQATLVGSMKDESPGDHMDYAGKRLQAIQGRIEIDLNERTNTGRVVAEFHEGPDLYRIVFDRFLATQPFQDGGIATRVYEHGDSGNGDPVYPKTWSYLAGWGKADVLKNGEILFQDYAAHFMVMERSRDRNTREVRYPAKRTLPGGETDPAGMEIDLWVRSKEQNTKNFPPYETFVHLFWDEVTWRRLCLRFQVLSVARCLSHSQRTLAAAIPIAFCLLLTTAVSAKDFTGRVVGTTDGDTITVLHNGRGEKIRLYG